MSRVQITYSVPLKSVSKEIERLFLAAMVDCPTQSELKDVCGDISEHMDSQRINQALAAVAYVRERLMNTDIVLQDITLILEGLEKIKAAEILSRTDHDESVE